MKIDRETIKQVSDSVMEETPEKTEVLTAVISELKVAENFIDVLRSQTNLLKSEAMRAILSHAPHLALMGANLQDVPHLLDDDEVLSVTNSLTSVRTFKPVLNIFWFGYLMAQCLNPSIENTDGDTRKRMADEIRKAFYAFSVETEDGVKISIDSAIMEQLLEDFSKGRGPQVGEPEYENLATMPDSLKFYLQGMEGEEAKQVMDYLQTSINVAAQMYGAMKYKGQKESPVYERAGHMD